MLLKQLEDFDEKEFYNRSDNRSVGIWYGWCFAGQYIATENTFPIKLNNNNVNLNGYNVDGSTYFKLRDIADVVGGFNVDFKNNTIRLSKDGYVYEDKMRI